MPAVNTTALHTSESGDGGVSVGTKRSSMPWPEVLVYGVHHNPATVKHACAAEQLHTGTLSLIPIKGTTLVIKAANKDKHLPIRPSNLSCFHKQNLYVVPP
uniref:Uncharacterized protein n=1 Tax=Hemiselmis andersenii TaxID=464988 RepID=A0A7S0XU20_HEMAN